MSGDPAPVQQVFCSLLSNKVKHAGLGLSIAKELVELHGGSVRPQSPGLWPHDVYRQATANANTSAANGSTYLWKLDNLGITSNYEAAAAAPKANRRRC